MAAATGDPAYRQRATTTLSTFAGAMESMPAAFHNMLGALNDYLAAGPAPAAQRVVEVAASAPAQPVAPGSRVTATLTLKVAGGWHINSARPTLDYLIPTAVMLDPDGARLVEARFPDGAMVTLGFAGKAISVYAGTQSIPLVLEIPAGAPAGSRRVAGRLSYQACNDTSCQPPAQAPFSIDLQVGPAPG